MLNPHEQLHTLAPLAQLNTILLDFWFYDQASADELLRPDTLLSLPHSITKLVLCNLS